MIDGIDIAVTAVSAIVTWFADKYIKEKTGKHIHEHVVDFVSALWNHLKNWAEQYLSEHPFIRKVCISAISVAATIKRAQNKGMDSFKLKVFAKEKDSTKAKVIKEEEIPLSEAQSVLERARADCILAQ